MTHISLMHTSLTSHNNLLITQWANWFYLVNAISMPSATISEEKMLCAANNCRNKSYKKHKWPAAYSSVIYQIRFWRLLQKTRNGPDRQSPTLAYYASQAKLQYQLEREHDDTSCLDGIRLAIQLIKKEIQNQLLPKEHPRKASPQKKVDRSYPHLVDVESTLIVID
jgi:hypothetical protein